MPQPRHYHFQISSVDSVQQRLEREATAAYKARAAETKRLREKRDAALNKLEDLAIAKLGRIDLEV